jgi:hypothetical protein
MVLKSGNESNQEEVRNENASSNSQQALKVTHLSVKVIDLKILTFFFSHRKLLEEEN